MFFWRGGGGWEVGRNKGKDVLQWNVFQFGKDADKVPDGGGYDGHGRFVNRGIKTEEVGKGSFAGSFYCIVCEGYVEVSILITSPEDSAFGVPQVVFVVNVAVTFNFRAGWKGESREFFCFKFGGQVSECG